MSGVVLILYIALPAFVANGMPVIASRLRMLSVLATPIDHGALWRGKPLLGKNKTWRGLIVAMGGAGFVAVLQFLVLPPVYVTSYAYENIVFAFLFGLFVGLLVIVGDALGSVIKRQLGIESGAPCIPLDQIDYMLVFIVGTLMFIHWTLEAVLLLLCITFFLNLAVNALAYVTGIKNTVW